MLPDVLQALHTGGRVVLQAPPGTGKTTRVPPALARQCSGRVLVLEPRRVAARAAARRVAAEWGCAVGEAVGWHVRGDRRDSAATRICFVTEGLFVRMLVNDPLLEGVSAVVLDEFHERSLDADLAIAMTRTIQRDLRDDLWVVVMSATLDAGPVAAFLDAPVITAIAPLFPLDLVYDPVPDDAPLDLRVARAVAELDSSRTALVFLPGLGEIRWCARAIARPTEMLYGGMTSSEQDHVLRVDAPPRIVLTTNLAESSVTVPGVTAVIDAGLARQPQRDTRTGLDRLITVPIAQDAAEQRAGRAARQGPGICRRLWTARAQLERDTHTLPAIQRADLAGLILNLLSFGEPDPVRFPWFDPPPEQALDEAMQLLERLGAYDGRLTPIGQQLAKAPLSPRLARFVLEADRLGSGRRAADLALAWSEGERLEGDLTTVVVGSHPDTRRIARSGGSDPHVLQRAALSAWPDRLARQRGDGAVMVGGTGLLGGHSPLFLALQVHPTMRGPRGEWHVTLQAEVDPELLPTTYRVVTRFEGDRVKAVRQECVGELVLSEHPAPLPSGPEVGRTLFKHARRVVSEVVPADVHALLARLRLLHRQHPHPDLPDGSLEALEPVLDVLCEGRSRFDELRTAPWKGHLLGPLSYAARQHLETHAPEQVTLASGTGVRVDYAAEGPPVVAARIQAFMGTRTTPEVAGEPVVVHLLAPNGRPQQITRDLANFWATTYFEVRGELRARYPKHAWPDDPTVVPPPRKRR